MPRFCVLPVSIIIPDNDAVGREHANKIAASLCGIAKRIRVLDIGKAWPQCPDKGDISDWIAKGGTNEKLIELVKALPDFTTERAATYKQSNERSAILVRADSLKPESISWAWRNRFAFGKMAMIAGDPGLGKSTILIEIAALHSKGGDFPCGEGKAIPCEVIFLTAEDGLRDTLIPRLIAADADLSKIYFLTGTKAQGGATDDTAMFDITKDVTVLRKVFISNPNIKILIIDPLTAYLGVGAKAKENTDVRRVLTPLVKLAEEFGVLLLANNHLNKNGGKALYRILDSIAFVALGRTIHLVAEDIENRDNKKFICDKSNIGSKPLGLTYIIQKCWIKGEQGEEIETSRISWGTKHIDETADEALATDANSSSASAKDEAVKFLQTILANGRVKIQDIEAEARAAGLLGRDQELSLSKPFRSARAELRIVSTRDGFGPGAVYYWSLPTMLALDPTMLASSRERATMGHEGNHDENKGDVDHGETSQIHHACPRPPYLPSEGKGKHEGNHGGQALPVQDDDPNNLSIPTFLRRNQDRTS
jgi:AAA domain